MKYTKQEVFDIVYTAFVHAGLPQSLLDPHKGGECVYHHPEGLRCAIGLFTDAEGCYDPRMEGSGAAYVIGAKPYGGMSPVGVQKDRALKPTMKNLAALFAEDVDAGFLVELQTAHDEAHPGDRFQPSVTKELGSVAEIHGLAIPECPEDPKAWPRERLPLTERAHLAT